MKYTKAQAKIVMFDNSDVITTSSTVCPDSMPGVNTGYEGECVVWNPGYGIACGARIGLMSED